MKQPSTSLRGPYVWFGYGQQKLFNNTQGQVSKPINIDTVNEIYKSQQPTEKAWVKDLKDILDQSNQYIDVKN